jgi:3-methyladenine DNA glycosylase AlkD
MQAAEIVRELESLGSESYRRILRNHGASEPLYGVKIADLKTIQKRIGKDHQLALDLYETGNYDAQYLAGLIVDDERMRKRDLQKWLKNGNCPAICASVVAWVAAGSPHGRDLALKWIDSRTETVAQTGWETLSSRVAITSDDELDVPELASLLTRVGKSIHQQPNHVRYGMNDFIIAVGTYVRELTEAAIKIGSEIGTVHVDMGKTACEVPSAVEHIRKAQKRGVIGKKRKSAKC